MIWITTSKAFSITLAIFVVSASLERLLSFRDCLTNLPLLLKNLLKSLIAMAYSSSLLPEVEHSSSLDSFLAFKAKDFRSPLALTISKSFLMIISWTLRLPMSSSRYSHVNILVPDDVLEGEDVDVINEDGFDNDSGNDDETNNYRKRRLAELSREIEGVINASGQWKYSFYTGQKFTTTKDAKDRVYLHSIESRRNLKLYKNENVRVRARCDGKVPIFIMSQSTRSTGPNREMEAGPSVASDPTTRSKKKKNICTNDDNQACSYALNAHDKGDLCPWVLVNLEILDKAVQDQLQRDLELQISMSKALS
ncbi:shikimate O-hydroxycinnamoyltransferase [Tanacetum coccineum]